MTHALHCNVTEPVWYVNSNGICLVVNGSCGSRCCLELVQNCIWQTEVLNIRQRQGFFIWNFHSI